jgi:hypothetical protein
VKPEALNDGTKRVRLLEYRLMDSAPKGPNRSAQGIALETRFGATDEVAGIDATVSKEIAGRDRSGPADRGDSGPRGRGRTGAHLGLRGRGGTTRHGPDFDGPGDVPVGSGDRKGSRRTTDTDVEDAAPTAAPAGPSSEPAGGAPRSHRRMRRTTDREPIDGRGCHPTGAPARVRRRTATSPARGRRCAGSRRRAGGWPPPSRGSG